MIPPSSTERKHPLVLVGMDPSLNNWGLAKVEMSPDGFLKVTQLSVTQPETPSGKQVRQNSKDVQAARQLAEAANVFCHGANAIFVEVPVGSQSARAMVSYGVCAGILGALQANGKTFIEVTPTEVKLAATGNKTATKAQMIEWAITHHPEASWPHYLHNGEFYISETKAEHMADALGAIYAGMRTPVFQQLLALTKTAA